VEPVVLHSWPNFSAVVGGGAVPVDLLLLLLLLLTPRMLLLLLLLTPRMLPSHPSARGIPRRDAHPLVGL